MKKMEIDEKLHSEGANLLGPDTNHVKKCQCKNKAAE